MLATEAMHTAECNDAELVADSLGGSRDAFRQIVERYQTLICSLMYSSTGNVSQSEDMAQETFLAAWKQLRTLREPDKLRAWLCGIVRNRTQKSLQRERREPVHHAARLEDAHESGGRGDSVAVAAENPRSLPGTAHPVLSRTPIHCTRGGGIGIDHVAARTEGATLLLHRMLARQLGYQVIGNKVAELTEERELSPSWLALSLLVHVLPCGRVQTSKPTLS
jgi:RNA polymerase sigma factor (sigma-70 family)